jgi:hypothetical protein
MTTFTINGVAIPPANIDEKTKRRFMFLMRRSETDRKQIPALVDLIISSARRGNYEDVEKYAAKLNQVVGAVPPCPPV